MGRTGSPYHGHLESSTVDTRPPDPCTARLSLCGRLPHTFLAICGEGKTERGRELDLPMRKTEAEVAPQV